MEEKEKKKSKNNKVKKSSLWKGLSLVLVILLAISIFTGGFNISGFSTGSSSAISKDEASDKAMKFINDVLLQGGMEATLNSIVESNGLYKLNISISGQSFESYISQDGELLLPQGYAIVEIEETQMETAAPTEIPQTEIPNIKMFVMSFCPYGQQAEAGLGPALEILGDSVEFEPHFVVYSDYASRMGASWEDFCLDEDETYCSMHGISELNEDIRQLCIWRDTPEEWWNYVNALNAECDYTNVDECWEGVAEEIGLDVEAIKDCQENKAELLLKKEKLLNEKFEVSGSPTVLINDVGYNGGRAPEDYKNGICGAFTEMPGVCEETLDTESGGAEGSC